MLTGRLSFKLYKHLFGHFGPDIIAMPEVLYLLNITQELKKLLC